MKKPLHNQRSGLSAMVASGSAIVCESIEKY